jgi:hypothetical protein
VLLLFVLLPVPAQAQALVSVFGQWRTPMTDPAGYTRVVTRTPPSIWPVFLPPVVAAQGPLTPGANLRVRTDANGYLISAMAAYTSPDGPLTPMANVRVRTDANGYLLVTTSPTATSTLYATVPDIRVTSTDGLVVQNLTASDAVITAQWSPRIRLHGSAWKSNATAASQNADWIIENEATTGAAAITAPLLFKSSLNDAAYAVGATLTASGNFTAGGSLTATGAIFAGTNVSSASGSLLLVGSRGGLGASADGAFTLNNNATTGCTSVSIGADLVYGCAAPTASNTFSGTDSAIAGRASAFRFTVGAAPDTVAIVAFNQTFTNAPACTVVNETTANIIRPTATTTQVTLTGVVVAGDAIAVTCLGY